jgi:Ca-activated chloride channel family protein
VSGLVHPEWLAPAALSLLGIALALGLARRRAARGLARLLGVRPGRAAALRDAALLLAFAAILAALLGPRWGERERRGPASGIDLALLVDVSRSMDASDTPPSRLARALRAADELLARLAPGDRAAIAAFAGRGVLLTPLTPDHEALRELLGGLDTELIHPRGSALAGGVRAALTAFEAGSERPRVLLVLSDGEDSGGGRDLPLAEAGGDQVRVIAAALGSEEGAMLPDHGAVLVGASGLPVVTRRSLAALERLAEATGGEVFRADAAGAFEIERLARSLHRDAGRAGGVIVRRERAVQVLPLAALAFALLLLEGLPAPRLLRRLRVARARRGGRRAAASALLVLSTGLLAAGPLAHEAALRLQGAGLARLAHGDTEGAKRTLAAAALATRETSLAALAYYHLGVAHLAAGELEEARLAFFDALALDPDDAMARFDLEWTLAALARRPLPSPPPAAASEEQLPRLPRPSPEAPRKTETEPAPGERPQAPPSPPALDAQERERLLRRVPDDPSRALRLTARSGPGGMAAQPERPAW